MTYTNGTSKAVVDPLKSANGCASMDEAIRVYMDEVMRPYWLEERRALLTKLRAVDKMLGIRTEIIKRT